VDHLSVQLIITIFNFESRNEACFRKFEKIKRFIVRQTWTRKLPFTYLVVLTA
jgi:hypothetical protein